MKLFKYIFYRIYKFYKWKWPYSYGENYAGCLVILLPAFCIFFLVLDIIILSSDVKLPHFSRVYILLVAGLFLLLDYFLIHKNDKYLAWINPEDYTNRWYQGWRGNLIMSLFYIIPIIVIFGSLILSDIVYENKH